MLLVPDGMADEPRPELGGRTPLEAAATPAMDSLAGRGTIGLVRTVPEGMPPGSDVANLAVLGYDPAAVFSGRSPLEAANIGVELGPRDVAYRCNFVAVEAGVMKDNTAGHIDSEEGRRLVAGLQAALGGGPFEFYAGVSYRNLLVWRGGELVPCTPPHDILDRPVTGYLPGVAAGAGDTPAARALADLQRRADEVLGAVAAGHQRLVLGRGHGAEHASLPGPLRPERRRRRRRRPGARHRALRRLRRAGRARSHGRPGHGLRGEGHGPPSPLSTITTSCGCTSRRRTRRGTWAACVEKVRAIERVDAEVLAPLLAAPQRPAVLVLPDHYTPLRTRTHDGTPVPFAFAPGVAMSTAAASSTTGAAGYSEAAAAATGLVVDDGPALMRLFLAATG